MSLRVKVYGLLAVLAILGAGEYVYKTKPAWFGSVAQAKGSGIQKARSPKKKQHLSNSRS